MIDAGIGFFPMRGNHETYGSPPNDYAIPAFRDNFRRHGPGASRNPTARSSMWVRISTARPPVSADLKGMSYSFDFGRPGNSARFVIIDNWVTPSKKVAAAGYDYGYSIGDQQPWISSRLDTKPATPSMPLCSRTSRSWPRTTRIHPSPAIRTPIRRCRTPFSQPSGRRCELLSFGPRPHAPEVPYRQPGRRIERS